MKKTILMFALAFTSLNLHAGEALFQRAYTTETVPEGHYEFEQIVRNRTGRSYGRYSAFDFRTEFEYGVTNDFQAAFYVNTGYMNAKNAPDDDDPNGNGTNGTEFSRGRGYFQGLSLEFIYRVLSPVKDPIGLAFYIEPEWMAVDPHNGMQYDKTFETEYRMLVQKNFLDDTLILAYNLVLEIEFIRFSGDQSWRGELDFNNELGLSYRVADKWFLGLEARNHNELGDFEKHEHSVYWLGPTVHYASTNYWMTLGFLKQVFGVPTGIDKDTGMNIGTQNRFLRSHEDVESTFKVGLAF